MFKRRQKKIAKIAKAIGWQFQLQHQFTSLQELPEGDEINVLKGEIEGIPARIFDLPRKIILGPGRQNPLILTTPETMLVIMFPSGKIPTFTLRPKALGDNFIKSYIVNKNYIVNGRQREKLLELFNHKNLAHYSQTKELHIHAERNKIRVQFNPHNFLPAEKECYIDLIAEGEFITKLVKTYLDIALAYQP